MTTTTTTLPQTLAADQAAALLALVREALHAERVNEREWAKAALVTTADTHTTEATRRDAVDALNNAVISMTDYDLDVCDNCPATYGLDARAARHEDCPGGHCADEACLCQACHR